jgi:uncharacterized protein (TIGR03118 family)
MKTFILKTMKKRSSLVITFILFLFTTGCDKFFDKFPGGDHIAKNINFVQTNLVSDTMGFNAAKIDSNLVNAWGIAFSPTGVIWINANGKGLTVLYDSTGTPKRAPVAIPFHGVHFGGTPSGMLFNGTTDFVIPLTNAPARFIFAAEDGTISGWSGGDSTVTVVDRSAFGSVYKGIAMANDGGANFLYATDFHNAKIDVFDKSFNYINSKPFSDPHIPAGFAPFNIANLNGVLFVTYAKQMLPDKHDDQKGPGNGFVNTFWPNGNLIKRFATRGVLNSPWGVAYPPVGFGLGKGSVLISNFGDGRINVFEEAGDFEGPLRNYGSPITIDGLWAIAFPTGGINPNKLFFSAGPDDESHGLFGVITKK